MTRTYFRQGPLSVTTEFVKARNRSIALSTIESVAISRKLFSSALALCGGLIGFAVVFGDLLYLYEAFLLAAAGGGLLFAAWEVGTLTIYSKLTSDKGWSVSGMIDPLQAMRAAIEQAIEERDARQASRRKRGGGAVADHGGEDADAQEDPA